MLQSPALPAALSFAFLTALIGGGIARRRLSAARRQATRLQIDLRTTREELALVEGERTRLATQFRLMATSVRDALVAADQNGVIIGWSGIAATMFGYTEAEAIGQSITLLMPEHLRDAHRQGFRRNVQTGAPPLGGGIAALEGQRKDGTMFPIELSIGASDDGPNRYYTAVVRDVTERVQAQTALRQKDELLQQAQKMEAIGRLAGGIAHDFNNLLTVIRSSCELMRDTMYTSVESHAQELTEIEHATQRAASLTRQLLAFSRQQFQQPELLDVGLAVRNTEEMFRRLLPPAVDLVIRQVGETPRILADPSQIDQIIMNLVLNAADAMPNGGTITVEAAGVALNEPFLSQHCPGSTPGPYMRLVVKDTGEGMDEETQARIFEPFFTTKSLGRGTGLGLATVYGIVRQSGGCILVTSSVGEGSTFTIYLPAAAPAENVSSPAKVAKQLEGNECILLAEDDERIRRLLVRRLMASGYRVLEAGDGMEALEVYAKHAEEIDAVVTDLVMPRLGGREMVECIAAQRPGIKVLYISGYTADTAFRDVLRTPGVAFLQKPFTPTVLVERLRGLLDVEAA